MSTITALIIFVILVTAYFTYGYFKDKKVKSVFNLTESEKSQIAEMYNTALQDSNERLKLRKEFTDNNKPIFNNGNTIGKWMVVESNVTKNNGKLCYEYYLRHTETLKHKRILEGELVLLSNAI